MRRLAHRRSDAMVRSQEGEQGFWPSYADMMSAVALILFFLMLLSYIQNLITGNDLRNTQDQLDSTMAELSDTRVVLSDTMLELTDTQDKLQLTLSKVDEAEAELNRITTDLDAAKLTLSTQQQTLEQQQKDLAAQDKLLAEQKALIGEQEEYLNAATEELLAMRSQMQTIAVLRLSILEQIRDSVVQVMGDPSKVSIGENGSIVLADGVFFDVGSSTIKAEAQPTLDQLIAVFTSFLSDPENIKYVDSIVISGHTDSTGSDEENRALSTDRANAVLGYLLDRPGSGLSQYASYFCAAGYGETRPVESNDTEAGRAANRRIEISIILKDDTVLDIVESYLNLDVPGA